jgi:hypothetical protein
MTGEVPRQFDIRSMVKFFEKIRSGSGLERELKCPGTRKCSKNRRSCLLGYQPIQITIINNGYEKLVMPPI